MSARPHPLPAGWLTAYHDGELEPARRDQVAAHLAGCAECRRELAELRALSQTLAAAELPAPLAAAGDEVWRRVQPRLPDRPAAVTPPAAPHSARRLLLRWSPGIGLLLLNGLVQVLTLALAALLVMPLVLGWATVLTPAWIPALVQVAFGATLGLPGWLLPSDWSGWLLFGVWLVVSAELTVLYLAWLGFELRHGPFRPFARTAEAGAFN